MSFLSAVEETARGVVSWGTSHWQSIAAVAVSTLVFTAIVATLPVSGPLAALAVLGLAGFASTGAGEITYDLLTKTRIDPVHILEDSAIGAVTTVATGGLIKALGPIGNRWVASAAAAGIVTLGAMGTQAVSDLVNGKKPGKDLLGAGLKSAALVAATTLVLHFAPTFQAPTPPETMPPAEVGASATVVEPAAVPSAPEPVAAAPTAEVVASAPPDALPPPAVDAPAGTEVARTSGFVGMLGGGCFLPGTLVATSDGLRPIETIEAGEVVISASDRTGERSLRHVTRVFHRATSRVVSVGTGSGAPIRCTEDHPFFVAGRGWTPAGGLRTGVDLVGWRGDLVRIVSVTVRVARAPTFNFEVEGDHTYFVAAARGEPVVWVHNDCRAGLGDLVEAKLQTEPVSDQASPINAGVNQTLKGQVGDQAVVIKPEAGLRQGVLRANIPVGQDMGRELASYQVAKYMDIDMPATVIRDDTPFGRAMIQEFRTANGTDGNTSNAVALFDAVIGNEDRHGGNMLGSGDHIIPIDHGLTFPNQKTQVWGNENLLSSRVSSSPDLTPAETDLLTRMQNDPFLRQKLETTLNDPAALDLMYQRIAHMLGTGKVATVSTMMSP